VPLLVTEGVVVCVGVAVRVSPVETVCVAEAVRVSVCVGLWLGVGVADGLRVADWVLDTLNEGVPVAVELPVGSCEDVDDRLIDAETEGDALIVRDGLRVVEAEWDTAWDDDCDGVLPWVELLERVCVGELTCVGVSLAVTLGVGVLVKTKEVVCVDVTDAEGDDVALRVFVADGVGVCERVAACEPVWDWLGHWELERV
jgi:hypothetical protein